MSSVFQKEFYMNRKLAEHVTIVYSSSLESGGMGDSKFLLYMFCVFLLIFSMIDSF